MESARCPVCEIDSPDRILELRDRLCGLEGDFRLSRCSICGTGYLNPRPDREEIRRYYPSEYEAYVRPVVGRVRDIRTMLARYGLVRRCHAVMRLRRRGDLLDIGCAMGEFASAVARRPGWTAFGIEMDSAAAQEARDRYGVTVIDASVEDVVLPESTLDVVTMWDVIEHMHDPGAVLDRVFSWLRPGGWLLIRTPNAASLQARLFGQYWAGYDAPRHLSVFRSDSLVKLLQDRGFVQVRDWAMSGSYGALVYSLGFLAQAKPLVAGLHRFAGTPLGQAALLPLVWLMDRRGAASVTVAAMKPTR